MENKEYNDITLICKDCGKEFVWTSGEQAFYDEKGFTNPPARCPEDRAKKKAERNNRNDFRRNDSNSTFAYRTDK